MKQTLSVPDVNSVRETEFSPQGMGRGRFLIRHPQ